MAYSLTPELEAAVLEAVRRGTPARQAIMAAGVSDETLRRWRLVADGAQTWPGSQSPVDDASRDRIVAFVQALARAEAECMQLLVSRLYHNATTPNDKTGWFDTLAIDKILSKSPAFRKHWHEERHTVLSGGVTHDVAVQAVQALAEDQLERLAGGDLTVLALPAPSE